MGVFTMEETQKGILCKKWYNFEDYEENDYREVFNYEALYIDDVYRNGVFLSGMYFDEAIEELNYNTYEVLEKIIEDIENVGFDYISILGIGMSTEDWKTFIEESKR